MLILGFLIVIGATLGGFIIAGGNPILLLHVSEFVVIGGIAAGILIIATPGNVLKNLIAQCTAAFKGGHVGKHDFQDLLKLLYELFMMGRRNGIIVLESHIVEPQTSAVFAKYPTVLKEKGRVQFVCSAFRPLIDGKIKPDQLGPLLEAELETKITESDHPVHILQLIGDSLPGVGIVAAVLGIINTMASISEGPEKVGEKVAAALTGTFLGVFAAYGFVNPLAHRIKHSNSCEHMYYMCILQAVSAYARGMAPLMAVEVARRALESDVQPESAEMEAMLKAISPTG
ncbi:MAG: motility-associated protein [Verrucomicrobiota bacterium]|nr:motility-associated protein [Verrucomicrobiota bacterium]